MNRTAVLRGVRDECTGEYGFVLSTMNPYLNDGEQPVVAGAELIAHDLLEHEDPKLIGDVSDEMQALGASMYIRGETRGYGRQHQHPERTLAHDVESNLDIDCNITPALGEVYDWASRVARAGVRAYISEAQYRDDDIDRAWFARHARGVVRDVASAMSAGYRRARRDWPRQCDALDMFDAIVSALAGSPYFADADTYPEIVLSYDTENQTAFVTLLDEEYQDED